MTSPEQLLLQFDLTIIPDPVLAKYMVESFYEKEAKVAKSKTYYANLIKQPWGVIDAYPPKERYEYERIKNLSRQKWIRKFPPIATVGEEAYQRLKSHSQVITHALEVLNHEAPPYSFTVLKDESIRGHMKCQYQNDESIWSKKNYIIHKSHDSILNLTDSFPSIIY